MSNCLSQYLAARYAVMQRCWRSFGACLIIGSSLSAPVLAADPKVNLNAYTEEWPPYNFMVGNEVKGISTELLLAACQLAQLRCNFHLVPWARAQKTVLETPNTTIYTTTRNAQRENQFKWVGPILPRTIWIYGKSGLEKKVHTLKDLAQVKIGLVREEASFDELLAAGVPKSSILVLNSNTDVMKMLKLGKINTLVNTEIGMEWNLRNAGVASNEMSKLMTLSEGASYYFAFNLKTDPAIIEKLQSSIDRLRREGKIEDIVRKYMQPKK